MVRRGASLDANWARLELLEEGQHVSTLQLPADHNLSISINAVNLKNGLRNIETNCCDRLHAWLLRIVGASIAPVPWRSRARGGAVHSINSSQSMRTRHNAFFKSDICL